MSRQALKGFILICIIALLINKWVFVGVLVLHTIFFAIHKIDLYQMTRAYRLKKMKRRNK